MLSPEIHHSQTRNLKMKDKFPGSSMAAAEELPEELMASILLKLPVKSLLRFKCVKKSWYSLINSPRFIRLHRSSTKKNDCFLVSRHFLERPPLERDVLSFHSYETLEDLDNQINLPFSFVGGVDLCGSCDGLVCITNDREQQIVICNPTIREFRSLFDPPSSFGKRTDYLINSVAFGSDPNTGKYTVLMIGGPIPNDDDYYSVEDREARLYDFSTDTWREPAFGFPPGPFEYYHLAISLNGAFHWCPLDGYDSENILSFHMSNEVTELIPLPDFAQVTHDKVLCVSTKSQLSLILYDYEEGRFEIWVMTEYGVNESWTRLFNIGPLPPTTYRPIAFWDEQRLLLRNEEGQLVSCDLQHHQNLNHFPIYGNFDVYPFSQSLVSVNGIGKSVF